MQSKISTFFKSLSASAPKPAAEDPPPVIAGDDDELDHWEKKNHNIFVTYRRRRSNPNTSGADNGLISKTDQISTQFGSCSKPGSTITEGTVVKNKKRSYAQFHLDFGQSDFLLHSCSTCGVKYTPGDAEDEKAHKEFHKHYTQGVRFKGWTSERVVPMPNLEWGRIILVLGSDPSAQRNKVDEVVKIMEIELGSGWIVHELCKVYLFISLHRIVGCVVTEPIKEAFKVVSCSIAGHSDSTRKKDKKSHSTTLHFGNIVFQREVKKRAISASDSQVMNGAIFCENKAVPAVCGIRAIWVTPSNRRKGIATQLLDSVRKSFCLGFVLERTQLAFSQPTSAGKALASIYTGTGSFLVYKANKNESD